MRTFYQNGITRDVPFFADGSDGFCVQELEKPAVEPYRYPGDSIKYELDRELVSFFV